MIRNGSSFAAWIRLAPLLLAGGASAQVGPSGFRWSYELVKTDLTVNEPVFLRFTARNETAEGATVNMGFNYIRGFGAFKGEIIRPDGRGEEGPKRHPSEVVSGVPPHIGPGESSGVVLLINKWFDFDIPGQYVLDIQRVLPVETDGGTRHTDPMEGRVLINVGPRDPARLRAICEAQQDRALKSDAQILDAADVLASIRDPVAVPYLATLLRYKEGMAPILAEGLGRIGGEAAADALISHLSSADPHARIVAAQALGRILDQTGDPMIKQKIRNALR